MHAIRSEETTCSIPKDETQCHPSTRNTVFPATAAEGSEEEACHCEPCSATSDVELHDASPMCDAHLRQLTRDQQRFLWHMRLGHINDRAMADLHNHVDGTPKFKRNDVMSTCPLCAQAKIHKAAGVDDSVECWQHVHIDFGFMVQIALMAKHAASSSHAGKVAA